MPDNMAVWFQLFSRASTSYLKVSFPARNSAGIVISVTPSSSAITAGGAVNNAVTPMQRQKFLILMSLSPDRTQLPHKTGFCQKIGRAR